MPWISAETAVCVLTSCLRFTVSLLSYYPEVEVNTVLQGILKVSVFYLYFTTFVHKYLYLAVPVLVAFLFKCLKGTNYVNHLLLSLLEVDPIELCCCLVQGPVCKFVWIYDFHICKSCSDKNVIWFSYL